MVEVLATDSTPRSHFRPEQKFQDSHDILTTCSILVSIIAAATEDTSSEGLHAEEIRPSHFSVKEYLTSERLKMAWMRRYHNTSQFANISILKACLTYLHYSESPFVLIAKAFHEFPLLKYAVEF